MNPYGGCGEVEKVFEVASAPVVACGKLSKMLEPVEASLDAVADFIRVDIVRDDDLA